MGRRQVKVREELVNGKRIFLKEHFPFLPKP